MAQTPQAISDATPKMGSRHERIPSELGEHDCNFVCDVLGFRIGGDLYRNFHSGECLKSSEPFFGFWRAIEPNKAHVGGNSTVCSARLSPLSRSVSLFSSAISSLDFLRSSAQCSSLTSAVFTMTKVESTPPNRLASSTQLAIVPTMVAADSDISEKGHIKIPDWFFIGGMLVVLIAGILALCDQTKTLIRKVRQRKRPGREADV
jgi:hypothetical protein